MALSDVQICNMALSHVGARAKIESLGEKSEEAVQCSIWYEFSLKQALEAADWNFARKRLTLVLHSQAAPEGQWSFRYVYPTDCVKAREIENPLGPDADAVPFEVETDDNGAKSILTDLEDAKLIYTYMQNNENQYSPLFVELLSWILASKIAFTLTGKRSVMIDAIAVAKDLTLVAPSSSLNEAVRRKPREAEWIRGR